MPLKPTGAGYHIDTPSSLTATNTVCWIGQEMGSAVAALMRNYAEKVRGVRSCVLFPTAFFPTVFFSTMIFSTVLFPTLRDSDKTRKRY